MEIFTPISIFPVKSIEYFENFTPSIDRVKDDDYEYCLSQIQAMLYSLDSLTDDIEGFQYYYESDERLLNFEEIVSSSKNGTKDFLEKIKLQLQNSPNPLDEVEKKSFLNSLFFFQCSFIFQRHWFMESFFELSAPFVEGTLGSFGIGIVENFNPNQLDSPAFKPFVTKWEGNDGVYVMDAEFASDLYEHLENVPFQSLDRNEFSELDFLKRILLGAITEECFVLIHLGW